MVLTEQPTPLRDFTSPMREVSNGSPLLRRVATPGRSSPINGTPPRNRPSPMQTPPRIPSSKNSPMNRLLSDENSPLKISADLLASELLTSPMKFDPQPCSPLGKRMRPEETTSDSIDQQQPPKKQSRRDDLKKSTGAGVVTSTFTKAASILRVVKTASTSAITRVTQDHDKHEIDNQVEDAVIKLLFDQQQDDDLYVLSALCECMSSTKTSEFSANLLALSQARGYSQRLLRWAFNKEVSNTAESEGPTLFRGVSVPAQLFSMFLKQEGDKYMHNLLDPLVSSIVKNKPSVEIDPLRIDDQTKQLDQIIHQNANNLTNCVESFFNALNDSFAECPQSIRLLLADLHSTVESKFPGMGRRAVGGFFFLRFLVPALVSQDSDVTTVESRRCFVLMSKIIQNISNQVEYGDKEKYLQPINQFVLNHFDWMSNFLDRLIDVNLTLTFPSKPMAIVTHTERAEAVEELQSLIIHQQHFISNKLKLLKMIEVEEEFEEQLMILVFAKGKHSFEKLSADVKKFEKQTSKTFDESIAYKKPSISATPSKKSNPLSPRALR